MPFSNLDIAIAIIVLILFVVLPSPSFRLPKVLHKLEEKLEAIPISGRTVKIMGWVATVLGLVIIMIMVLVTSFGSATINSMKTQGYSEIQVQGSSWSMVKPQGCEQGDIGQIVIKAKNPTGQHVYGVVCIGTTPSP